MKRFYTILILLIGVFTIKSQAQTANDPEAKKDSWRGKYKIQNI